MCVQIDSCLGVMVAVIRKKKKKSWECQGDVRIVGLFSLLLLKEKSMIHFIYDGMEKAKVEIWEVEEDGPCFRGAGE